MYRRPRESRNQRRNREFDENDAREIEKVLGGRSLPRNMFLDEIDRVLESVKVRNGAAALPAVTFFRKSLGHVSVEPVTCSSTSHVEYYDDEVRQRSHAAFSKHVLKGVDIDQAAVDKALAPQGLPFADYADVEMRAFFKHVNLGRPTGLNSQAIKAYAKLDAEQAAKLSKTWQKDHPDLAAYFDGSKARTSPSGRITSSQPALQRLGAHASKPKIQETALATGHAIHRARLGPAIDIIIADDRMARDWPYQQQDSELHVLAAPRPAST